MEDEEQEYDEQGNKVQSNLEKEEKEINEPLANKNLEINYI